MEVILAIIAIYVLFAGIGFVMRALGSGARAAVDTVKGKGSFGENFGDELRGMGAFSIRAKVEEDSTSTGKNFDYIQFSGRGLLPNTRKMNLEYSISLFTKNKEDQWAPVLSTLDDFQEEETIVYQVKSDFGYIEGNVGFKHWVNLGAAIIPTLTPAYSGSQDVLCLLRILDKTKDTSILAGIPVNESAVIGSYEYTIHIDLAHTAGYTESAESRDKLKPHMVQLAVATAMADGSFDRVEGELIKEWIKKQVATVPENRAEQLKNSCNQALKSAYADTKDGTLSISKPVMAINDVADDNEKYEAIELCMDVMAADGAADQDELELIWKVAKSLGLDKDEVEKLKDKKILSLNITSQEEEISIEAMLGIDPGLSVKEKKAFLRAEFEKWNSRIHSIDDPEEKRQAQNMLDLIAQVRNTL